MRLWFGLKILLINLFAYRQLIGKDFRDVEKYFSSSFSYIFDNQLKKVSITQSWKFSKKIQVIKSFFKISSKFSLKIKSFFKLFPHDLPRKPKWKLKFPNCHESLKVKLFPVDKHEANQYARNVIRRTAK